MDMDRISQNANKAIENMSGVWSTGIFHVSRNRNTIFLLFHLYVARKKYNRVKN